MLKPLDLVQGPSTRLHVLVQTVSNTNSGFNLPCKLDSGLMLLCTHTYYCQSTTPSCSCLKQVISNAKSDIFWRKSDFTCSKGMVPKLQTVVLVVIVNKSVLCSSFQNQQFEPRARSGIVETEVRFGHIFSYCVWGSGLVSLKLLNYLEIRPYCIRYLHKSECIISDASVGDCQVVVFFSSHKSSAAIQNETPKKKPKMESKPSNGDR